MCLYKSSFGYRTLKKNSVGFPINSLFRKLEILPKKIPTGAVILKRSDILKISIFFLIENMKVVKIIPIKAP